MSDLILSIPPEVRLPEDVKTLAARSGGQRPKPPAAVYTAECHTMLKTMAGVSDAFDRQGQLARNTTILFGKSDTYQRVNLTGEDSLKQYLRDIGKYPLLTKEDEVRLAQAIEKGKEASEELEHDTDLSPTRKRELRRIARKGRDAERTFVQSNLRLVVSIAKKYQASGLPLLDLIQEGNLGLMHAVEKFDWRKGFKFSTYATWWIRQAITRGIANTEKKSVYPSMPGIH